MRGYAVTSPGLAVMMTTVRPAPATRTRTSASPGPMEGTGNSSRRSAPPSWCSTMAFIRRGALTKTLYAVQTLAAILDATKPRRIQGAFHQLAGGGPACSDHGAI